MAEFAYQLFVFVLVTLTSGFFLFMGLAGFVESTIRPLIKKEENFDYWIFGVMIFVLIASIALGIFMAGSVGTGSPYTPETEPYPI